MYKTVTVKVVVQTDDDGDAENIVYSEIDRLYNNPDIRSIKIKQVEDNPDFTE